jgi:hypothetical protein
VKEGAVVTKVTVGEPAVRRGRARAGRGGGRGGGGRAPSRCQGLGRSIVRSQRMAVGSPVSSVVWVTRYWS